MFTGQNVPHEIMTSRFNEIAVRDLFEVTKDFNLGVGRDLVNSFRGMSGVMGFVQDPEQLAMLNYDDLKPNLIHKTEKVKWDELGY